VCRLLLYKINGYQETNLFNFLSQFAHITATFKVQQWWSPPVVKSGLFVQGPNAHWPSTFRVNPRSVACTILDTNDRKIFAVSNHLHLLEWGVVFGPPFLILKLKALILAVLDWCRMQHIIIYCSCCLLSGSFLGMEGSYFDIKNRIIRNTIDWFVEWRDLKKLGSNTSFKTMQMIEHRKHLTFIRS